VADSFEKLLREKGVYFFLPQLASPLYDSYLPVCLAEGLDELGISVVANVNAYRRPSGSGDWLFRQVANPTDAFLFVADFSDLDSKEIDWLALQRQIVSLKHRSAILCMSDGINRYKFNNDIPVFATHGNKFVINDDRRSPWAFGLSRSILLKTAACKSTTSREPVFIRDFRPSGNQGVRSVLDLIFVEHLSQFYKIDSRLDDEGRFHEGHYQRLSRSLGCLAYGGNFLEDIGNNPYFIKNRIYAPKVLGDRPAIVRWDSWRFWESMASGCLTVALDFDKYGLQLPVMPVNGTHYIGLKLESLNEALDLLRSGGEKLGAIAAKGQKWALEHYSPRVVAERFISKMEEFNPIL
jgi:hypothetical protein